MPEIINVERNVIERVSVLQLTVLELSVHPEDEEGTPLKDLLKDPYILIAAGWNCMPTLYCALSQKRATVVCP